MAYYPENTTELSKIGKEAFDAIDHDIFPMGRSSTASLSRTPQQAYQCHYRYQPQQAYVVRQQVYDAPVATRMTESVINCNEAAKRYGGTVFVEYPKRKPARKDRESLDTIAVDLCDGRRFGCRRCLYFTVGDAAAAADLCDDSRLGRPLLLIFVTVAGLGVAVAYITPSVMPSPLPIFVTVAGLGVSIAYILIFLALSALRRGVILLDGKIVAVLLLSSGKVSVHFALSAYTAYVLDSESFQIVERRSLLLWWHSTKVEDHEFCSKGVHNREPNVGKVANVLGEKTKRNSELTNRNLRRVANDDNNKVATKQVDKFLKMLNGEFERIVEGLEEIKREEPKKKAATEEKRMLRLKRDVTGKRVTFA
ncbi:hypothetical protein SSX86_004423 [Deinandra increscens subsp. villosa]|uniref:Uncharacterized protein n=1 Tax=Deinandra increscens subsp. villosa TaxID=3103831 RepID=A0AAP0DJ75_9ASTR